MSALRRKHKNRTNFCTVTVIEHPGLRAEWYEFFIDNLIAANGQRVGMTASRKDVGTFTYSSTTVYSFGPLLFVPRMKTPPRHRKDDNEP